MARADDMRRELMSIFQAELDEHLELLSQGVLALEQGAADAQRDDLLSAMFRAAHSLKGAARAVNFKDISQLAHRLEDMIDALRKGNHTFSPQYFDLILAGMDAIKAAMKGHLQGAPLSEKQIEALFPSASLAPAAAVTPPITESQPSADEAQEMATESQSIPAPEPEPEPEPELPKPPATEAVWMAPSVTAHEAVTVAHLLSGAEDTIRVATTKLDILMDALGELLVVRMRTDQTFEQARILEQRMLDWRKQWRRARPYYQRWRKRGGPPSDSEWAVIAEFLAPHETNINALSIELNTQRMRLLQDRNRLQLVTDELQEGIYQIRMLPMSVLFAQFPRMVRDLAREQGKDIQLRLEGGDTEADRQILELCRDPLTQLLRNAVDHGIETPVQRSVAGKPPQGLIRLRAEQRGSHLVIEVADDGQGIDPEAVRRAAIQHGVLGAQEAVALDEEATLNLIFRAGLSTAHQVSELSGRGIGLDVVRTNLEQMRGVVRIANQPKRGVVFSLLLPLTLAVNQVLLIEVGGQMMALPATNIERILRVPAHHIGQVDGQPVIHIEGHPLPLLSLARLLRVSTVEPSITSESRLPVAVLNVLDQRLALWVDDFVATQEVMIKPLGRQLRRVRNVAGITLLGDGRLVAVLNVADLMKAIRHESAAVPLRVTTTKRRCILVTDDSITTRTLAKNILENAGYEVRTFADGQDAWNWLHCDDNPLPDAIVSDVNMPRMDGFALTVAVKGDPRLSQLPVVLVTSLDSPEDRLQGMEAGADAYMVKNLFDQRELLATIERLIG